MNSEAKRNLSSFIKGYWDAWRYLREKTGRHEVRIAMRFPIGTYRYMVRIIGGRFGYLTGWME